MWTKMVFGLLLSLVMVSSVQAAGRTFYDGFEDGTTNAWGEEPGVARCPVVTAATDTVLGPYAGTKMVRCNWTSSSSTAENLRLLTTTYYNQDFFLRWRFRFDQNMDGAPSGSGVHLFRFLNGLTAYWLEAIVFDAWVSDVFVASVNVDTNYPSGTPQSTTQWHEFEMYISRSTGVVRSWIDGTQNINATGVSFGTVYFEAFNITSNWPSAHDNTNHLYVDEFEVYADEGTGGTGLMSDGTITQGGADTTPPAAPTGVSITQSSTTQDLHLTGGR